MQFAVSKIQNLFRINKCTKILNEHKQLFIEISKDKTFEEFKKEIMKKNIILNTTTLCSRYNNYKKGLNINYKIVITLYFIYYYPNDMLNTRDHPYDQEIFNIAESFIKAVDENSDVKKIWNILNLFNITFKRWCEMDKNRLIEDCMKSYYYKCEHINKIKSNQTNDKEQKNDMIIELERQKKDLLINILLVDKSFDVTYFEKNYDKIVTNIINLREQIYQSINDNMKNAYYNLLCDELKQGNNINILDLLKTIGNHLLIICPEKNKNKFNEKFSNDNLINLLCNCEMSYELHSFIFFIIDFIILLDAPINDTKNIQFRKYIESIINVNYSENLPLILLLIKDHIDNLLSLIVKY